MTKVHGIMCSYLGDGEVDIGKTGHWLENFTDTMFFYDSVPGTDPRKFAVDYAKTFPNALFAYHSGASYFVDPAGFRLKAFTAALNAWHYADADWVVFVDASDGLSVDTPHDALELVSPDSTKFKYLYDEATANDTAGQIAFTLRIFLNQGLTAANPLPIDPNLQTSLRVEKEMLVARLNDKQATEDERKLTASQLAEVNLLADANTATFWTCNPEYLDNPMGASARRVMRMAKVSVVKAWTTPDWVKVDTYAGTEYTPLAGHPMIISYAYARYSEVDYFDPSLWIEANDVGFANRKLVEAMPQRSVALPLDYDTPDPTGFSVVIPPTGVPATRVLCPPYCFYVDTFDMGGGNTTAKVFGSLWRKNPRDGVWYQQYVIGTVPLDPTTGNPDVGTDPSGNPNDPAYWDIQIPQPRNKI